MTKMTTDNRQRLHYQALPATPFQLLRSTIMQKLGLCPAVLLECQANANVSSCICPDGPSVQSLVESIEKQTADVQRKQNTKISWAFDIHTNTKPLEGDTALPQLSQRGVRSHRIFAS